MASDARLRVILPNGRVSTREIWAHRDLLYFLAWRDVKVRYAQSLLGAGWAVGQPLLMMAVLAVFLGALAKVPAPDGVAYAPFALAGLVPWTFFANAVATAGQSIVNSAALVEKVSFPKLLVPAAGIASWLPDLAIATLLLIVTALGFGLTPPWPEVAALPAFGLLALLAAVAVGVWASALNVAYRDVKYAVPFLLQLGLFATPVAYSADLIPAGLRVWYGLNPMVGVVEGFRWSLLGTPSPSWSMVGVSAAAAVAVLTSGISYFRRVERHFADVI